MNGVKAMCWQSRLEQKGRDHTRLVMAIQTPTSPTPLGSSTSANGGGGGARVRHATARAGVAQARGAMGRMKVRRPATGLWDLPPRTCV